MRSRGLIVSLLGLLAVLCIVVAIGAVVVLGQLKGSTPANNNTPTAVACQQVLPLVLKNLSANPGCGGLNPAQACYGNYQLTVSYANLAANVTPPPFSVPGNIAPLDSMQSIQASPNLGQGQWGVAMLKLRADLPGSVGGAPVTFILYGDMRLENAAQPGAAAPANNGVDPSAAPLSPLNAFYFSNGLNLQPTCNDVAATTLPSGGLLIDSPDGKKVQFTADGAQIVLGSGVIMRASANASMTVTVLHGGVTVTSQGQSVTAGPLQEISVPLGGPNGLVANGPPAPAKPADISLLVLPSVCQLAQAAGLSFNCPTTLPAAAAATNTSTNVPPTLVLSTATPTHIPTSTRTLTFTPKPLTSTPTFTSVPIGPLGGGNRIIYVGLQGKTEDLYAVDIDPNGKPSAPVQLTRDSGDNYSPTWSPDSQKIAFIRTINRQNAIWLMDSNGANQHAMPIDAAPLSREVAPLKDAAVSTGPITIGGLTWSPLGNKLLFTVSNGQTSHIYVTPANKLAPTILSTGTFDTYPAWSPDGNQIVYAAPIPNSDGSVKAPKTLYLIQADGSDAKTPRQLYDDPTVDATFPMWRPRSNTIAFVANQPGGSEIDMVTSAGSKPRLFVNTDHQPTNGDWSPNGNDMVFASGFTLASQLMIVSFPQTDYQTLANAATSPRWSPTVVNTALVAVAEVPTIVVNATLSNGSCDGYLPSRVKPGMQGIINTHDILAINVSPNDPAVHPENKTLGTIPPGVAFDILKGPVCTDQIVWWAVNFNGISGWVGEGTGKSYWFDPVEVLR